MPPRRRGTKRSRPGEDEDEDEARLSKRMACTSAVRLTTTGKVASALREAFQQKANPARAVQMKKYMRNQFEYFGLHSQERRQVYPEIYAAMGFGPRPSPNAAWPATKLVELSRALWRLPERDFQYFAVDLLDRQRRIFCEDFDVAVQCLRMMVTEKSWWDTVDMVATHLVGCIVELHPQRGSQLMDRWIDDQCMWIRRTALLHQLGYKERCDEARLFRYCLKRADEEEFFIRKAIGWALRQYARTRPKAVKKFVLAHDSELSVLSKREALKHLSGVKC